MKFVIVILILLAFYKSIYYAMFEYQQKNNKLAAYRHIRTFSYRIIFTYMGCANMVLKFIFSKKMLKLNL